MYILKRPLWLLCGASWGGSGHRAWQVAFAVVLERENGAQSSVGAEKVLLSEMGTK